MNIKESEYIYTFIGKINGVSFALDQLSKCLDSKILKDMSDDIKVEIFNLHKQLKNSTDE